MLTFRSVAVPAVALAVAVGLSACGSDGGKGEEKESAKPTPSATSSAPAYLDAPDGVTLTEPGTALDLGEEGVIAFERRQGTVGVLAVTVERIERTSFQESFVGWNVDDVTAARTPYFVRLKITNVGDVDLGGLRLDNVLWADDGQNLEAPNYYTELQQPLCSGGPLPTAFAKDATVSLCQVYFIAPAHSFESVTFEPPGGLEPVTWSGELSKVTKPGKKGKKSGKKSGKQGAKKSGKQGGKKAGKPGEGKATETPSSSPFVSPFGTPSAS